MVTLQAPAKINLFLEVLGKRKDGYHNLNTLFLKLQLFDKISLTPAKSGITISCAHPQVPASSDNLVWKAANLFRKFSGVEQGVHINIKKNIPVAAGLGGGSSDAAATLIGLNKLWGIKAQKQDLLRIGKKIGADVPLFLIPDVAAVGKGRGDRLSPVPLLKKMWIVLIIPAISVSTKEIFGNLPIGLTNKRNDVKLLIHALREADPAIIGKYIYNRLETVTFRKHKALATIKRKISALGVRAVLMSGSGSVIFGIVKTREEAMCIKRRLQDCGKVMVVKSL
ncbi:MAG: 4-(cytidine 5'-diphospho)-2-C-methyl-D-erythritol kinase [PVC group bacterium]|nr:4-(cytidine 5'-diphospho)-2-C-methyl-D-erythritol kinase [PVC group bacterium]